VLLKTHDNLYKAPSLGRLDWIEHGFGTRDSRWPEPERLALLKQVHSARVIEVSAPGPAGEGDALVTNEPGILVGVRTADCVPVLLADETNRVVAAVHAGWKGTAAGIVSETLKKMTSRFGTDAKNIHAAIGPCIGYCCYEVGYEVVDKFLHWMPELHRGVEGKQKLDLITVNRRQLEQSGVPPAQIDSGAPCTFCRPLELHSFRRDAGRAGRMISAIGIQ
jgi:YfiH family protein